MNYLHPSEIMRLSHLSNHPFDEIRADSLTPSDYILLGEAQWTPMPHAPQLRVLRRAPGVDAFARALTTAFLVNERAGNLSLHLSKSRYARYNRFQHVEVTAGRRRYHWPADSLEEMVLHSGKAVDLVSALVDESSKSIKADLADKVLGLMVQRGLLRLEVERRRSFGIFPRSREWYVMGPRVRDALSDEKARIAAGLISSSAETRPELTEELLRDVKAVLAS